MAFEEKRGSLSTGDEKPVDALAAPRIGVGLPKGDVEGNSYDDDTVTVLESEEGHDIKYKTLTWKKTAALLFCEYIWYELLIATFVLSEC